MYGIELDALGARFDHVGVAVPRIADAIPIYMTLLGGRFLLANIEENDGFAALQLSFGHDGKFEIIQPYGPASPLARFLAAYPSGALHHVTFKVDNVRSSITAAQNMGLEVVGIDLERSFWQQAYLHPRNTLGVLIQIVQSDTPFPRDPDLTLDRLLERLDES
ncbi:MAG TPA: VOC family protein [Nocardioidaceae bacterium]|jgi:methylmalonyl-CoA/ethylmalonyl-CoA epimerase